MKNINVLIVDDEPHIVEMLGLRLEANDLKVFKAFSGDEAMGILSKEGNVDVVMTDIMMPGMTGIELLREIKKGHPDIEVIMITGFAALDTAVEAVRLGAYDYLKKPFEDMQALMRVVSAAAEKRRLVVENRHLTEELKASNEKLTKINLMLGDNVNELVMLHHIVETVSGKVEIGQIIDQFLDSVVVSMDFRRVAFFTIDKAQNVLELKGFKGWENKKSGAIIYRMDNLPANFDKALKTAEHVYLSGFERGGQDDFVTDFSDADSKAIVYYPLKVRKDSFGLLVLESDKQVNWGKFHSLELFIHHTALILENAMMLGRLVKINEDLKAMDRLKTDFISTVSHELRTPLTSIKSGVELVLDKIIGEITDRQEHVLNISKQNVDRLSRLIEDLLDISRIESGKVTLNRERITIEATIEKAVLSLRPYLKEKKIEIKESFGKKLPDIFIDEDKIIQVLVNLISNAAKFSKEGSSIDIDVGVSGKKGLVEVNVTDHGVGMAREDMPRLFQKFSQLNRAYGPGSKGTGLGLAISKELLSMHGCEIWIKRSVEGQGTTFAFTLPVYVKGMEDTLILNDNIDSEIKKMQRVRGSFSLVGFKYSSKASKKAIPGDKEAIVKLLPTPEDKAGTYSDGLIICLLKGMNKAAAIEWGTNISKAVFKNRKKDVSVSIVGYPSDGANKEELVKKL